MLLTLVDSLRCPAPHEESNLVLSVRTWQGQRIAEGELGCPACHARYQIHDGTVEFTPDQGSVRQGSRTVDPLRLAAQLALTEPGGIVLLTGRYADAHEVVATLVESTFVLVGGERTTSPTGVNILVSDRLPFVDRALRGAAIDAPEIHLLSELERCVRPGGRVVAPLPAPRPSNARIVAEDSLEWVAELESQPAIQLQRRVSPRM